MRKPSILVLAAIFLAIPTPTLTDEKCEEKARRDGGWMGWKVSAKLRGKSAKYKSCYMDEFYKKLDLGRR
jgi:hypothetical protein